MVTRKLQPIAIMITIHTYILRTLIFHYENTTKVSASLILFLVSFKNNFLFIIIKVRLIKFLPV